VTPDQLSAIRARLDAVTPGNWKRFGVVVSTDLDLPQPLVVEACSEDRTQAENDVEFIAHAPTDLRALLDEVERLTAEREILHELADRATAERVQKARADAFCRGVEAMRQAVLKVSESRANLPVKDGIEAAWCRSAQCIVDDVRVLTVEDEP
jgi:hypothetical protein